MHSTLLAPKQISPNSIISSNILPILTLPTVPGMSLWLVYFLARIHPRFTAECLCLETPSWFWFCVCVCEECYYGCSWEFFLTEVRLSGCWVTTGQIWALSGCVILPGGLWQQQTVPSRWCLPRLPGRSCPACTDHPCGCHQWSPARRSCISAVSSIGCHLGEEGILPTDLMSDRFYPFVGGKIKLLGR